MSPKPGNGEPEGEAKAFSAGDLGARGGLLHPVQGVPEEDEEHFKGRVVRDAAYLLRLRNAMDDAERVEAERDFDVGQAADVAAQED